MNANANVEKIVSALTFHVERCLNWARNCNTVNSVENFEFQAFGAIQFAAYSAEPQIARELTEVLTAKWEEWQPLFWEIAANLPEPPKTDWRLG